MQAFFVYLLKVIIYSGILFGYYHIALRNKRFHYYNRFYLLMSVALSLLLPFLQLEIWKLQSGNRQVIDLANIMVTNTYERESANHSFSLSFNDFLLFSYLFIAVCLLISFVSGLLKIMKMKKKYPSEKVGGILFVNTDLQQAPFSFLKICFGKKALICPAKRVNRFSAMSWHTSSRNIVLISFSCRLLPYCSGSIRSIG